jgi:glycosyltransferase involved in cell wall biosynthesis
MNDNETWPRVTFLLLCYNQEDLIVEALEGALSQDYPNLEIIVADDASGDSTFSRVEQRLMDYSGPHQIKLLQNPKNLGIGGNIDHAVRQSTGQLIFIAGGDDISLPERVRKTVEYWLTENRKPDLIGAYLLDMDQERNILGTISIATLDTYRTLDDWIAVPPHVIGAAQAWTRRLFDRFGGLPKGAVGEDMIMAFRAIALGTARTLPTPLVRYRRGGLTSKRRNLSVAEVVRGLTRKLNSTRIELRCMINDARSVQASSTILAELQRRVDIEDFIERMFSPASVLEKIGTCLRHPSVSVPYRIRLFVYSVTPWLLAPFFFLKKLRYRSKTG